MSLEIISTIEPWYIYIYIPTYLYTMTVKQSKQFGVILRFSFGLYSIISNAKIQGKIHSIRLL